MFPENIKYTKEHTWIKVEGNTGTIGITDYAQSELGDIVFVELPSVGEEVEYMSEFGVVESTKTVSDLYSPISGEVLEVNDDLFDNPEIINEDSYEDGWLITVEMNDPSELDLLMNADEYQEFLKEDK